jgi:hypothetical protein
LQPWPGGVRYDENRLVIKKIKELTSADFPESVIDISDNGKINYKQLVNITENPAKP